MHSVMECVCHLRIGADAATLRAVRAAGVRGFACRLTASRPVARPATSVVQSGEMPMLSTGPG